MISNAGWNAFGTLFNIVIALLLAPLLIHRLGVEQWGLLLLVWSVAGVLGLANFGLGEATLRYVAHYHADGDLVGVNRVFGATLTFYILVCIAITVIVWVATPIVADWVKVPDDGTHPLNTLLRLTTLLFSAGMIANAYRAIPMALHRYDISSVIGLIQGVVRSGGLVVLVLVGLGVLHLVIWEVLVAVAGLIVNMVVARNLLPGVRFLPSMSLAGIRETIGYSTFSFMTHIFLVVYREAGRLLLANRLGTASVAYLGTPDSISYRLHMVVVSGIETLMPRFSASRDPEATKSVLIAATWVAFACAVVLYLPLAVLMPDFLRLWISPEFARESARVGQLITLGLIGPVVFAPVATLFRGQGHPGFVTAVMAAAGTVVLIACVLLIPVLGVTGVGYAYLTAVVAWFIGLGIGWIRHCGRGSCVLLVRVAVLPLVVACGLGFAEVGIVSELEEPGWIGLVLTGASFAILGASAVVGLDLVLGGTSPARLVFKRLLVRERIAP